MVEPAYREQRRAASVIGQREDRAIAVSLSYSLAVGWLIPRLDQFRAAHPEIDIALKTDRGAILPGWRVLHCSTWR